MGYDITAHTAMHTLSLPSSAAYFALKAPRLRDCLTEARPQYSTQYVSVHEVQIAPAYLAR